MMPIYPIIRPDRTAEFGWYVDEDTYVTLTNGQKITIPKGYRFDGHSVPRILWAVFPPFGRDIYAALVHDVLYEYAITFNVNRSFADQQYWHFLTHPSYEVSRIRSIIMYIAVRLIGCLFFYIDRK